MSYEPPTTEVFPPPLYKYLPLGEGQSPPWTERLQALLDGKAYYPSPSDFNDPFDCLPHFFVPETKDELLAGLPGFIRQMQRVHPNRSPEEVQAQIRDWFCETDLETIRYQVKASTKSSAEKFGVFCLSERIESVLMWSHYAENHRGIALMFDFRHQPREGIMPLFKVVYQRERPVVKNLLSGLGDEQITDALKAKANFWAYEAEWRAFKPLGARTTISFDPRVIRGVVLGANCLDDIRDKILHMLAGRDISLGKMVVDDATFGLKMLPISGPV